MYLVKVALWEVGSAELGCLGLHVSSSVLLYPPLTSCVLQWLPVSCSDFLCPPVTSCVLLWLNMSPFIHLYTLVSPYVLLCPHVSSSVLLYPLVPLCPSLSSVVLQSPLVSFCVPHVSSCILLSPPVSCPLFSYWYPEVHLFLAVLCCSVTHYPAFSCWLQMSC